MEIIAPIVIVIASSGAIIAAIGAAVAAGLALSALVETLAWIAQQMGAGMRFTTFLIVAASMGVALFGALVALASAGGLGQ